MTYHSWRLATFCLICVMIFIINMFCDLLFNSDLIWFLSFNYSAFMIILNYLDSEWLPFLHERKKSKRYLMSFCQLHFCLSNDNDGGKETKIYEMIIMMRTMMMLWWGCIQQILNNCEDTSVTKSKLAGNPTTIKQD